MPAILPAAPIRFRSTALRSTIRAYWVACTAVGVAFEACPGTRARRSSRGPRAFQGLGDGDDVDGLAPLEQVEDDRVDLGVGLPVEILGPEELGDLDHRVAVDQDRAEDGLLGFDGLRGQAIDHRLEDAGPA